MYKVFTVLVILFSITAQASSTKNKHLNIKSSLTKSMWYDGLKPIPTAEDAIFQNYLNMADRLEKTIIKGDPSLSSELQKSLNLLK